MPEAQGKGGCCVSDRTIFYLTDNSLEDDGLGEKFRELIRKAAGDIPILSVSQKPLDFGTNICVGDIGRSGSSMEYQVIVGMREIKTKWVIMAEHDCIYSSEHFNWTPPDTDRFWYNDNVWLCQLRHDDPEKAAAYNGMFSYIRHRRVQSQLIAYTPQLLKATENRYGIERDPAWLMKYPLGRMGEPGSANFKHTMKLLNDPSIEHLRKRIKEYLTEWGGADFKTKIPNIDVRHGKNLTGHRRGNHRRMRLEPWGTLAEILNV